jgi:uncharacterized hydrophobic protein (TIGR00271 family)
VSEHPKPSHPAEQAIYHREELRLPAEGRETLYHSILEASTLDPEYLTMLVLSALIALLGLVQNSAAVIIGAMLISPLMNPILAGGLALILGDWRLGRKTTIVLGISIAAAILVTWFVAEIVPLRQPTPEILARTNPNLLDLFIAMLSGLAGTLAMRATSSAFTIIPGVAIAVAVIPPLATVGYGLSARQGGIAAGAFLLFITNLVSIMISAGVVFLLFGFRPRAEAEKGRLKLKYRMAISAAVLALLAVPLVQTLRTGVRNVRTRSEVTRILERTFKTPRSSITDLAVTPSGGSLAVRATVRTTEYFDDRTITAAREALRTQFGSEARLEIDQLLVTQGGLTPQQAARLRDFITGRMAQPPLEEPPYDFRRNGDQLLSHLQRITDELLVSSGPAFRPVAPVEAQLGANRPVRVTLYLASAEPLVPQTTQVLAGQLSSRLAYPVELHAQVQLEGEAHNLTIEKARLTDRLSAAERQALARMIAGLRDRPDLHLAGTVAAADDRPAEAKPPLQQQIENQLAASGVSPTRWSVRRVPLRAVAKPAAAGGAEAAPQMPPPALRVDLRIMQEF